MTSAALADRMIPTGLFRSRWKALFWSAGILWTAYDVASATSSPPPTPGNGAQAAVAADATGEAVTAADLAVLANAGG